MKISLHSAESFYQLGQRGNQEDARYPDLDSMDPHSVQPFFVVCDGVGGCDKGEVASATVSQAFGAALSRLDWNADGRFSDDDFLQALDFAYNSLDDASNPQNQGMATTLTFLAFHAGGCYVAHIGDSRIYHVRPGVGVIYRSEDHSLVNALLRSGNITPDEAINHPKSNVITRCMSVCEDSSERDEATAVNITDVRPGDYFMLCTDGVTHCVTDDMLVNILEDDISDKVKIRRLAKLSANSTDNNTAILVHIGDIEYERGEKPEDANEDDANTGSQAVATEPLVRREDGTHDVSAPQKESFFKKLFNRLFN